jgi:hypothetical protein
MKKLFIFAIVIMLAALTSCAGEGQDGSGCSVTDNEDGTYLIVCGDGTSITLQDGEDGLQGEKGDSGEAGVAGSSCTAAENDESYLIDCDDGTSFLITKDPKMEQSGVLKGSFTVENEADLVYLENFHTIQGNLVFACSGLPNVMNTSVTTVEGSVVLQDNFGVTTVSLGSLQTIGKNLHIQNNENLDFINFNSLVSVGERLDIMLNEELTSFDFSSLASVGSYVEIWANPSLSQCDLDTLESQVTSASWYTSGNGTCN